MHQSTTTKGYLVLILGVPHPANPECTTVEASATYNIVTGSVTFSVADKACPEELASFMTQAELDNIRAGKKLFQ